MDKYLGKHSIKAVSVFFAGLFVLAGIGVIKKSSFRKDASQTEAGTQSDTIPMQRFLASGFPIINITGNRREGYQVTLRNEYNQSIVAFELGAGKGRMTRDLIYEKEVIRPGASRTEFYAYEPVLATEPLTLFGVVFEDGSGDGQPHAVKAIKDMRRGAKLQMAQFTPILERALESANAGSSKVLDELWFQTNALVSDPVEGLSSYVKFGLHNEKQRLLSEIHEIRAITEHGVSPEPRKTNTVAAQLLKLKANNEERTLKLANRRIQ